LNKRAMSRLRWTFPRWRRFSYVVRTEIVKICAATVALVALAAAQDLSPLAFGTKPPLLLVFGCIAGAPAAIGAGLFTDALSGLPFGCSAVFFFGVALLVRFLKPFAFLATAISAALYQTWIAMWGGDVPMQSAYVAAVYAIILYPVAHSALRSVKRHAGIDAVSEGAVK
jgi:hypothetical protein